MARTAIANLPTAIAGIRQIYRYFVATIPPVSPVRLRFVGKIVGNGGNGREWYGRTSWGPGGVATISISLRCSEDMAVDILIHEYAHVLDGVPVDGDALHPESWGVQYALVYAAWERKYYDSPEGGSEGVAGGKGV